MWDLLPYPIRAHDGKDGGQPDSLLSFPVDGRVFDCLADGCWVRLWIWSGICGHVVHPYDVGLCDACGAWTGTFVWMVAVMMLCGVRRRCRCWLWLWLRLWLTLTRIPPFFRCIISRCRRRSSSRKRWRHSIVRYTWRALDRLNFRIRRWFQRCNSSWGGCWKYSQRLWCLRPRCRSHATR